MKVTVKEVVTRFHTIEVDDKFEGMNESELEDCVDIRDRMWDNIALNGWGEEFVHECTFYSGTSPDTLYYKG